MTKTIENFLRYVKIDTQSSEESTTTPSTMKQHDLAGLLVSELEAMGAGALRKAVKEGDSENGCFMAGESCALVTKIQPAAEIIRDVVTEGEALLKGAMQWVK